jgi:hypothetical protein
MGDSRDHEKTAALQRRVASLLEGLDLQSPEEDLRQKVQALIPVFHELRKLGCSLLPDEAGTAALDRILFYLRKYPQTAIPGDEFLVISGIQEWARRIRQLRVEYGWRIITGITAKEMKEEEDIDDASIAAMRVDEYMLIDEAQDRDAAHRWNVANGIRRKKISVVGKILEFFRSNVAKPVTGEELRYVAGNKTEWARRVRELRTEQGWPIVTRATGNPGLSVGVYVLEADRQSPEHDRTIPDPVRSAVLRRDDYHCTRCGWSHAEWNRSDPRNLELHHVEPHVMKGENTEDNLITLCTVCHDATHSNKAQG